jgi:hypothetical protein
MGQQLAHRSRERADRPGSCTCPRRAAADEEHRELARVPDEVTAIPANCRTTGAGHRTGPAVPADRHRRDQMADFRRSPARQAEHRPGRRAGHPLEVLASLDRDLLARPHLPRCSRRRQRQQDAATSTAPASPTNAGTPTPRQHNDHNELQLPYLTGSCHCWWYRCAARRARFLAAWADRRFDG